MRKERDGPQEGSVSDGLRVGCHVVVLVVAHVDEAGLERREDALDEADLRVWCAVLDYDLDVDIAGVSLEFDFVKAGGGKGRTRAWPSGATVGPWSEWIETMWTSLGRYFSNASRSGAFTEVWPETIAPTLVAGSDVESQSGIPWE